MHASTQLEQHAQQLSTKTDILVLSYEASLQGPFESSRLESKRILLLLNKVLKIPVKNYDDDDDDDDDEPLHSHFSRIWGPELFKDGSVRFCNFLHTFGNAGVATLVLVLFRIHSL